MSTERILGALAQSAAALFREADLGRALKALLRSLGKATGVSRVYYFENHRNPKGELVSSQRCEWVAPGVTPQIDNAELQGLRSARFRGLRDHLSRKPFHGLVKDLSPALRAMLRSQDILAIALVPIFVNKEWAGFLGFDDCATPRRWSRAELDSLQATANMLGGAIERRQSEDTVRSILEDGIDSLGSGLFIISPDSRIIWMNRAMEEFFGIRRKGVLGTDVRTFIHEQIERIILNPGEFTREVLSAYQHKSHIHRLRCEVKEGPGRRHRVLHYWSTPLTRGPLAGGRIAHYIDMTPLEHAAEALRASERQYRDLVEKMDEGLAHIDENLMFRFVNRSFCRMLGYTAGEMIGLRVDSFLDERDRPILQRTWRRRKRGEYSRYELRMRSKGGDVVPLQVSAAPVRDEGGRFRGSYAMLVDIRERRSLDRMRDDILTDVSHELKAPTAKIQMGLELLKKTLRGGESDGERLGIAMIESEIIRLRRNLDSLMECAAFEAGMVPMKKGPAAVEPVLRAVVEEYKAQARERGVTLSFSVEPRNVLIDADAEKFIQLMRQLVDNAIKFSHSAPVMIVARRDGGELVISVADRGRGLEPRYLERIFDKHYQRYPSEAGLGLGLTISRKIVDLHGWRIWAESPGTGKGMTVLVAIPGFSLGRTAV
ncbi:MAG: PAS domain S-box protein [Candidatus Aureabacteria bacterium]|nr:PAS domain S-box protein [Candidatus Auribacterota bacterium]